MKARGSCLVVLLYVFGILAIHPEDSSSVESLKCASGMSLGVKRTKKANCMARKTAPLDGEVSGLAMSTAAYGTTTVTVHITQSSGTGESMPTTTATPAAPQADPSHLMFNSTSPLAVIANDTTVDSVDSSGGATNASFGIPSLALYPIHTYEVPYAFSEGNTLYMNATVTTGHGLAFLISTWSSEGTMYTSNLGVLLPEPMSSILGISPNATSALRSSATRTTLGDQEQARTTTTFVNSTRTMNVNLMVTLTTTSMVPPAKSDTQTSLLSSRPARLGARYAKNLFQPKPFADLRSYLQRAKPKKAYQPSDIAEKKNNDPTRNPVTNTAPARLAPAIPAVAVVALAVVLVSGLSFNTTSSSTVASKATSDETTVFTGGPAPLHILNSIITPSLPASSEATPLPCRQGAAVVETEDDDPGSSTSYGTRRPALGVAASPIPAEPSNPASSTEDVVPASETLGKPAVDFQAAEGFSPPEKREPKGFKPKPNPCAAGACSSASRATRAPSYSLVAFVVGLLVLTMLLPTVSASKTHIQETSGWSSIGPSRTKTTTDSATASAVGAPVGQEHASSEDVHHDEHAPNVAATTSTTSTLSTVTTETSSPISSAHLVERGACGASFPHPCSSDAASRRVVISAAAVLAAALTMFGVFYAGSR